MYLYHFDEAIGSEKHTAQHYLGSCVDLRKRDGLHRSGKGAKILAWCITHGIGIRVVRTWYGGRRLERKLKARHNSKKLCPICTPPKRWTVYDNDALFEGLLYDLRSGNAEPLYVPWYEEEGAIGEFESLHPLR